MGLTLGDGLAILSVAGFLITVICYYGPKSKEEKITFPPDHCPDHSGVCKAIDNFTDWLNKIERKLDRVIERREIQRED
jgi:hypothetical protein